ncbi:hypothetical protein CSKR_111560 [Clonorchis sinensis]|uniref:Uncharacterized protein n=1 Tax=Clonorchis sinensis TaxID=79923 RepID=A0A419PWK6_CLOSI|nr:hypothetical protein CSKR_111560 [Clonorchis sinensis]
MCSSRCSLNFLLDVISEKGYRGRFMLKKKACLDSYSGNATRRLLSRTRECYHVSLSDGWRNPISGANALHFDESNPVRQTASLRNHAPGIFQLMTTDAIQTIMDRRRFKSGCMTRESAFKRNWFQLELACENLSSRDLSEVDVTRVSIIQTHF